MYRFPAKLYSDVRIETRKMNCFSWRRENLRQSLYRDDTTAFIRVYDGRRWYYSSITDPACVQRELEQLASMAMPSNLRGNPLVESFEVNRGHYGTLPILPDGITAKRDVAAECFSVVSNYPGDLYWTALYEDRSITRRFISSRGADVTVNSGGLGIKFDLGFCNKGKTFNSNYMRYSGGINSLVVGKDSLKDYLERCSRFNTKAVPLSTGEYTVILSPASAGIFAHESFGHKSEADFMIGDRTLMREWPIGSRVAPPSLSIWDDGSAPGSGRIYIDDEGTVCKKTWLIRDGILSGRLHSVTTASHLGEKPTGNARAVNYRYEPIVRMTNTCIAPGEKSVKDIFGEVEDGVYVEGLNGASGLTRFTMNPTLAWRIKNGRIEQPLRIPALSGDMIKTLWEIDGISKQTEMFSSVGSGCAKLEQAGLPVGYGGPFVRVKKMDVR